MDPDDIQDLFRSVGPVDIRRMFGGKGIYVDGRIVAVELRGELMLKGDAEAGALYEAAGSARWAYAHAKTGKRVAMPYWPIPSGAYDDADEAEKWVRTALDAAIRLGG
ncbi:MAG: TfoX/Sxy family protein [Rhizobium sp.]|jgi:DNA transformation protein|nr:TfoX/Sxy family protein [Rhizobium sp.]